MLSTAAKNTMLDALGITHASLHSAFSNTGANEISGGSPAYARKAITQAAAASASMTFTAMPVFDVPGGGTVVQWLGYWSAITAGVFKGMAPLSPSAPLEFTTDLTANTIFAPAHGYVNTNKVVFYGGTVPAPLVEGTIYYVVTAATDTFQVAATSGGAAIDLTAHASASVLVSRIEPETVGTQTTLTPSVMTIALTN